MIPSSLPTSWAVTSFGGPARWAASIPVLVDYLRPRYPTLTFLGGLGDQTHVAEGNTSAHNPITKDPVTGVGIVLAIDLGVSDGNMAPLLEIRDLIYAHPNDPRMAGGTAPKGNGYLSGPDDQACNWPIGTGWNGGNSDTGHLHVNVAARYFPFRPDGYLPSMDLTTPWDFMTPAPIKGDPDMSYRIIQSPTGTQYAYSPHGIMHGFPSAEAEKMAVVNTAVHDDFCLTDTSKPPFKSGTQSTGGIEICDPAHWDFYASLVAEYWAQVASLPALINNATAAGNNATTVGNSILNALKTLVPAPVTPAQPVDLTPLVNVVTAIPAETFAAFAAKLKEMLGNV